MPKYFFDRIGGGGEPRTDAVGTDYESLTQARNHAMTLLPIKGVDLPMIAGEFRTWTSTVRDEQGATVARFVIAILNDSLEDGVERVLRPMA